MRVIKLFLISVVVLFLLITAISSLLPSEIRVSRAVDVNASNSEVAKFLNDLSGWRNWNEFVKPATAIRVSGDSLIAKELTVVLSRKKINEISSFWMQGDHPILPANFVIFSTRGTTTLQWYFTCHFKWYPWEKLGSMVYDKQLGSPMEQSLRNLKQLIEQDNNDAERQ